MDCKAKLYRLLFVPILLISLQPLPGRRENAINHFNFLRIFGASVVCSTGQVLSEGVIQSSLSHLRHS